MMCRRELNVGDENAQQKRRAVATPNSTLVAGGLGLTFMMTQSKRLFMILTVT